jgi:predicted ATPase/class 3 adenylate cyclase
VGLRVRCSKCGTDNAENSRFCDQCATPLSQLCAKCKFENSPQARFCAQCAAPLGPALNERDEAQTSSTTHGERRHLTILFCDLVGSVTLTSQLDPEEWRATVAGYQRAASEAITRFGGEVMRYVGDGIMAFFGYPTAHENDAERAARAGLGILDRIAKLNEERSDQPRLSVRIGIDSGPVVVGTGAGDAIDAFGDAANIAARVQSTAETDTVVASEATHRLISGLFVVEDRGAHQLKGIAHPVKLYRVVRPSGMRSRFEAAAAARGLTPFVGREDEMRSLLSRWERTQEGQGQVVTIIGEAGIGKSRLVQRFHEQLVGTPHTWIEAGAGPFFQNTPFYSISEMLQQFLGGATSQDRLSSLAGRLQAVGLQANEAIPLVAPLLNLSLPPEYRASTLPPDQQRRRLLTTLVEWLVGSARTQPLVSVIEDLHWADPSTLELIQLLVEQGANAPALLLYTARPEFQAQWPLRSHHTQVTLNRLSVRDIHLMVREVAAQKALSNENVATVIERTGGVPLFVEELTRAVLESGDGALIGRSIPVTLYDSLMARLDRLGPAREVAQVGAVIGAEFSYEMLHAIHPVPESKLQSSLRSLTDAELLYARGIAPEASYQFKHALIRDAAYEALLKSRRKELHRSVANAIDTKFTAIKENQPEVLARHWTEAGDSEQAITAWQKAGDGAAERRAYREAEQHYRNGLAILQTSPESAARDRRELPLQLALGNVMQATHGWSSSGTEEIYARARLLAERGGSESLEVLHGLQVTAATRGELRSALALADQMMVMTRGIVNSSALCRANYAQAATRHFIGELAEARQYFREAIDHYREEDFLGATQDPGVSARMFAGHNEWHLGYPDRGLSYWDEALSMARRLNNQAAMAFVLATGSLIHDLRGDFRRALMAAKEAAKLGTDLGFPLLSTIGKFRRAHALVRLGEAGDAVAQLQESLAEFTAANFYLTRDSILSYLAEAQVSVGAIVDASATVEQALETNSDSLLWKPDLLRLRGELRLKTDGQSSLELAEQDFRKAIELTQRMMAKSFELRATTSLARLLRDTGRRDEARRMLGEIYNWFTEGFDTLDLRDAKALLEELS